MPIVEEKEQSDMVYKVMPRGLKPGQDFVRPAPTPSATSPIPPAPMPGTASPMGTGSMNGSISGSGSMAGSAAAAVTGSAIPTPPIMPMSNYSGGGGSGAAKKIIIGIIVLLVIAGAVFGYMQYKKSADQKKIDQAKQDQQAAEDAAKQSAQNLLQQQHDSSQLTDEWRLTYFGATLCSDQANCGDAADPDKDGLSNLEEFTLKLSPNNSDTDQDGIADGDEVHIFHYDPTTPTTTNNLKYPDAYQAKTKWNVVAKRAFNDTELKQIAADIVQYGLHIPTTTTLDAELVNFYTNYGTAAAGSGISPSLQPGALDRDTQRSDTMKQIGFALLKYKDTNSGKFPDTQDFAQMITSIKPLLSGKAINTTDPTNTAPYTYGYQSVGAGTDFKLSYFSETQNQAVILDAKAITNAQSANLSVQRDTQRKADLEQLAQALFLYSNDATNSTDPDVRLFPAQKDWKTALAPKYLATVPTDPKSTKDYDYSVNADMTDFAIQVLLEVPPSGAKGYLCTSSGCANY